MEVGHYLAIMYMHQRKYPEATKSFKTALRVYRRNKNEFDVPQTQIYIAKALMFDDQLAEAEVKCCSVLLRISKKFNAVAVMGSAAPRWCTSIYEGGGG